MPSRSETAGLEALPRVRAFVSPLFSPTFIFFFYICATLKVECQVDRGHLKAHLPAQVEAQPA
jgi:hypothetical protein